jgi:DNA topoisomerase IB
MIAGLTTLLVAVSFFQLDKLKQITKMIPFLASINEALKLLRKALISSDRNTIEHALAYSDTTLTATNAYIGVKARGGNPNHDPRNGRFAMATRCYYDDRQKTWVDDSGKPVSKYQQSCLKNVPKTALWAKVNPDKSDLHMAIYKSRPKPGSIIDPNDEKKSVQWVTRKSEKTKRIASKWARLKKFDRAKRKIDAKAYGAAMKGSQDAAVAMVMSACAFRIGSEDGQTQIKDDEGVYTGETKKTYGASTLLGKHVTVKGNSVRFKFTAKDGVEVDKTVNDKKLSDVMNKYLAATKPNEQIFHRTTDSTVKRWMRKTSGMTINNHDFRYWHATALAWQMLLKRGLPKGKKELNEARQEIGDAVASVLGNTRAKALGYYINPCVWVSLMNPFQGGKSASSSKTDYTLDELNKAMELLFASIDFDTSDVDDSEDPWDGFDEDSKDYDLQPDYRDGSAQKKSSYLLNL